MKNCRSTTLGSYYDRMPPGNVECARHAVPLPIGSTLGNFPRAIHELPLLFRTTTGSPVCNFWACPYSIAVGKFPMGICLNLFYTRKPGNGFQSRAVNYFWKLRRLLSAQVSGTGCGGSGRGFLRCRSPPWAWRNRIRANADASVRRLSESARS